MNTLAINATDFSRGLSDYLNQVQYRGQVFDIERGKRVVARLSPAVAADGFPIARLDDLLANGPSLSAGERKAMAQDVRLARAKLKVKTDPWGT